MSTALAFSGDTLIRSRNGRLVVHVTASPVPAFETDQPALIGWICQFTRPTDPGRAIDALPAADRRTGQRIVEYLVRSGVLVQAGSKAADEVPVADASGHARNHLRMIARSAYDMACDVVGLGPERVEAALREQGGIGLERRLMAVLAALDGLRNEMLPLRRARLAQQLSALGIGPGSSGLKLHIGCGPGHLDDWVNIDVEPAPLAMNVLWGLPFAEGSVSYVFVSHFFEHLFFPRDVSFFLSDLRRVMAPGAVLRIVVPDIRQCIDAYVANDDSFFASRRETWSWWPKDTTRLEDFLAYAGAGPDPAYLFEAHKYGYDFETLAKVIGQAGFVDIQQSGYMDSRHAELRVDEVSAVAKARYGDRHYSLFVEATAPQG